jgi:hypothetical protein
MPAGTLVKTIRTRWSFKSDPLLWAGVLLLLVGAVGISKFAHGLGSERSGPSEHRVNTGGEICGLRSEC